MKVLHINTYDSGGAGNAAMRIHRALLDKGVDSDILFLTGTPKQVPRTHYYLANSSNVKISTVEKDTQELTRLKDAHGIVGKIDCEILSFPNTPFIELATHPLVKSADIIHLHWISRFIDYKSFFGSINKPIVWTFHDENPFLGIFHYRCDMQKNYWAQHICEDIIELKRNIFNTTDIHVISPSFWLLNRFKEAQGFNARSTTMIRNTIEPARTFTDKDVARRTLDIDDETIALFFMSADLSIPRKRFELFTRLAVEFRNSKIAFYCAGKLDNETTLSNIKYLGEIKNSTFANTVYSAMDGTIVCSSEDNLPNILLESMQNGTPVIGMPRGGIPEVINDVTGICAKEDTFESLVDAIHRFSQVKNSFNRTKILQYSLEEFSPSVQAQKHIDYYEQIRTSCTGNQS